MSVRQRAGLMRQRVTIQTPSESTNAFGEVVRSWSTASQIKTWAQVEVLEGTERFMSGAERTELPTMFRVRYRSSTVINTECRLLWPSTSDVYDIESVADLEGRNKILEIAAVKRG